MKLIAEKSAVKCKTHRVKLKRNVINLNTARISAILFGINPVLSINEAVYQPKPPESRWVILGKRCGQLFAKIRYG